MIASDIMTRKVATIHPGASVQEAAQLLDQKRLSGAPVVDADDKIIGIITEADIISKVDREGLCVIDIMSHDVIAVDEETPVNEIAALLTERKIQGTMMGGNRFRIDMPRYIDFYLQGRLNLDEMISKRGKLEDVNEAFRAMKAGEVARTVLMFE